MKIEKKLEKCSFGYLSEYEGFIKHCSFRQILSPYAPKFSDNFHVLNKLFSMCIFAWIHFLVFISWLLNELFIWV